MAGGKKDEKTKSEALLFWAAFQNLREVNPALATYVQADNRYPRLMIDYFEQATDLPPGQTAGELSFQAYQDRHAATGVVFESDNEDLKLQTRDFYDDVENGVMPEIIAPVVVAETPAPAAQDLTALFNVPTTDVDPALTVAMNKIEEMAPKKDAIAAKSDAVIVPLSLTTPVAAVFKEVVETPVTILAPLASPIFISAPRESHVDVADLAPLQKPEKIAAIPESHVEVADLAPIPAKPPQIDMSKLASSFVKVSDLPALEKKPAFEEMDVERGDSLSKLVREHYGKGLGGRSYDDIYAELVAVPENKALFEQNAKKAGKDFDDYALYPGDKILMPVLEKAIVAPIPAPRLNREMAPA